MREWLRQRAGNGLECPVTVEIKFVLGDMLTRCSADLEVHIQWRRARGWDCLELHSLSRWCVRDRHRYVPLEAAGGCGSRCERERGRCCVEYGRPRNRIAAKTGMRQVELCSDAVHGNADIAPANHRTTHEERPRRHRCAVCRRGNLHAEGDADAFVQDLDECEGEATVGTA